MGRNVKEVTVPIGGIIQTNYSKGALYKQADGKEYLLTLANSYVLDLTNYPKFKSLVANNFSSNSSIGNQTLNGYYETGTATYNQVSFSVPSANYNTAFFPCIPFSSDLGSKAPYGASGNYAWAQSRFTNTLYGYNSSANNAWIVDTSNKKFVNVITPNSIYTWYDSSTSTYRCLGCDPNTAATFYNFNSTDGTTITTTAVTGLTGGWDQWTNSGYYYNFCYAKDNFVLAIRWDGTSAYKMWRSTNSGVTFTDVSTAFSGAATFASDSQLLFNYDGTTVFLNAYSAGVGKYSLNQGSTWTNTTVTGTTTAKFPPASQTLSANGATTSQIMYVSSSLSTIYYSSNGGQSWTTTTAPTVPVGYRISGTPAMGSLVYMGGAWYLNLAGNNGNGYVTYVAKSTDNGATWTNTYVAMAPASGMGAGYNMLYTFNSVLYLAYYGAIWKSTDGVTWTQIWDGPISYGVNGVNAFELTSYIQIGNIIINKSTFATFQLSSSPVYNYSGGYMYYLSLGSDYTAEVGGTSGINMTYAKTSATIGTFASYQPEYTSTAGSGNYNFANTREYMRIK